MEIVSRQFVLNTRVSCDCAAVLVPVYILLTLEPELELDVEEFDHGPPAFDLPGLEETAEETAPDPLTVCFPTDLALVAGCKRLLAGPVLSTLAGLGLLGNSLAVLGKISARGRNLSIDLVTLNLNLLWKSSLPESNSLLWPVLRRMISRRARLPGTFLSYLVTLSSIDSMLLTTFLADRKA